MDDPRTRPDCLRSRLLERHASGCGFDPGDARPGPDLSLCTTWRNHLEVRVAGSKRGHDSMVVPHFAVWSLHSKNAVWTPLWRPGCGNRLDGMDGDLCDDCVSWRRLERGKHCSGEFAVTKPEGLSDAFQRGSAVHK